MCHVSCVVEPCIDLLTPSLSDHQQNERASDWHQTDIRASHRQAALFDAGAARGACLPSVLFLSIFLRCAMFLSLFFFFFSLSILSFSLAFSRFLLSLPLSFYLIKHVLSYHYYESALNLLTCIHTEGHHGDSDGAVQVVARSREGVPEEHQTRTVFSSRS